MLAYTELVPSLFDHIDKLLLTQVHDVYQTLQDTIKRPLILFTLIYFACIGIGVMQGWIRFSYDNMVRVVVKIAFIYTFALHWDVFHDFVIRLMQNALYQLAAILSDPHHRLSSDNAPSHFAASIQHLLTQIAEMGLSSWVRGTLTHFSPYITGFMICAFGFSLILTALYHLIIAMIMLSVLFSLAPLFIAMALTPVTYSLFSRWLGQLTAYALVNLFVSVSLALVIQVADWMLKGEPSVTFNLHLLSFMPLMVLSVIAIGVLNQANQLAHKIGSGLSSLMMDVSSHSVEQSVMQHASS